MHSEGKSGSADPLALLSRHHRREGSPPPWRLVEDGRKSRRRKGVVVWCPGTTERLPTIIGSSPHGFYRCKMARNWKCLGRGADVFGQGLRQCRPHSPTPLCKALCPRRRSSGDSGSTSWSVSYLPLDELPEPETGAAEPVPLLLLMLWPSTRISQPAVLGLPMPPTTLRVLKIEALRGDVVRRRYRTCRSAICP